MLSVDENTAIWTGLVRNLDAEGEAAIRNTSPFWKNHDQGAATVLVAALDPALDGKSVIQILLAVNIDCEQTRKAYCYMTAKCAMPRHMRQTQKWSKSFGH
jgi:hypothetical protein